MLEDLKRLTEAVQAAGADIAPTYAEYVQLAFAIAADCGEAGRTYFHHLCALSPKYDERHADRLFGDALRANPQNIHLGTAFFLAGRQGVEVGAPPPPPPPARAGTGQKGGRIDSIDSLDSTSLTPTRTRVHNKGKEEGDMTDSDESTLSEGSEPYTPLPTFDPTYVWPALLHHALSFAETPPQRDVLFLSLITTLGATLGHRVKCLYGRRWVSPNLQTFVVAPPASGKGVMAFARLLADPLHEDIRRKSEEEMKQYKKDKLAYDALGKERQTQEAPVRPPQRMFLIPGNNSGTGILENIIASGGTGLIFEAEADTLSSSIGADYGHWSDILRKLFDHDRLAYNRRTDREFREVVKSFVSVLISGTPAQVQPLIPTVENGLFSRQVFYYMPRVTGWRDQFGQAETDFEAAFRRMGYEWFATLKQIAGQGTFVLHLHPAQKERFNDVFSALLHRAEMTHDFEMNSSVVRLGVTINRILMVVSLLRSFENGQLCRPATDIPADNVKDGIVQRWQLLATDADFDAVLALVEPLYLHATHLLSFLTPQEVKSRGSASRDMLLASMPKTFTRKELVAKAEEMGIPENTALTWLRRGVKKRTIKKLPERGGYEKD